MYITNYDVYNLSKIEISIVKLRYIVYECLKFCIHNCQDSIICFNGWIG